MKIKTVSISNLLSFTARTDVETDPDITFDIQGTEGGLLFSLAQTVQVKATLSRW
jgi:hypothetical protein